MTNQPQNQKKEFSSLTKFAMVFGAVVFSVFLFMGVQVFSETRIGLTLFSNPDLEDGLVGHWTFDGPDMISNVADRSGQGNDGALQGQTSTTTAIGVIGQALEFDGSDDYVDVGSGFDALTAPMTVSAWVYLRQDPTAKEFDILGKYGGDGWIFRHWGGGLQLWFNGSHTSSSLPVNQNQWYHWVATWDGSDVKYYVDGTLHDTVSTTDSITTNTDTLKIGQRGDNSFFIDGRSDDVRIYNRALSADEVQRLYDLGATTHINTTITTNPDLENGLVGHWSFDGPDMISNVADVSGSGNTAFLQNFPATSTAVTIGKIGSAVSTDGDTSYKITTDVDIGAEWTASAWFKYPLATSGSSWWTLFRGSNDHQILINRSTNLLGVYDNGSNSFNSSGFDTSTLANGWHHIATIGEGTTQDFYIDGSFVGTASFKSTSDIQNIGNSVNGNQNWGVFDDVRIYNRALSADEISRLYDLGATTHINTTITTNPDLENGLVGHWSFDGPDMISNVADRSGQDNDGALQGQTSTSTAPGAIGQALEFDGSNDYVDMGDVLDMGTNDWTASFWIKRNGHPASSESPLSKSRAASSQGRWWLTIQTDGELRAGFEGDNTVATTDSTTDVADDAWHFVTATWNRDGNLSVYVDGGTAESSVDISADDGDNLNESVTLKIGAYTDSNGTTPILFFGGQIDDVRIYNRALTENEIQRLYNLGR